jgi:hypothetical protein
MSKVLETFVVKVDIVEMCENGTLELEEQSSTSTPLIKDSVVYVSTQLEYAQEKICSSLSKLFELRL